MIFMVGRIKLREKKNIYTACVLLLVRDTYYRYWEYITRVVSLLLGVYNCYNWLVQRPTSRTTISNVLPIAPTDPKICTRMIIRLIRLVFYVLRLSEIRCIQCWRLTVKAFYRALMLVFVWLMSNEIFNL